MSKKTLLEHVSQMHKILQDQYYALNSELEKGPDSLISESLDLIEVEIECYKKFIELINEHIS